MLNSKGEEDTPAWLSFNRSNNPRTSSNGQFFPIYIEEKTRTIVKVGECMDVSSQQKDFPVIRGLTAVFPVRENGDESIWRAIPSTTREWLAKGYVRVSKFEEKHNRWTLSYIPTGLQKIIESGVIGDIKKRSDGSLDVKKIPASFKDLNPKTVWYQKCHNADDYGGSIVKSILPGHSFSFPKSLYAVHDAIRFFVANKPNALVLDFFAGSGTTLHAVNLLNAEDGGKRRCILVTNNEVSGEEVAAFRKKGLKPGDAEWEAKGIAQYVTWPRTTCSIKGVDVKGAPLKGEYLGGDKEHPRQMSDGFKANAAFFKLGFVDPAAVSIGRAFKEILPLLWMKAGAHGACPRRVEDNAPYHVLGENRFAVLMDETFFNSFKREIAKSPEIETIYLVTDFEPSYKAMAACFPRRKTCQLYTDYLENFRVNRERK